MNKSNQVNISFTENVYLSINVSGISQMIEFFLLDISFGQMLLFYDWTVILSTSSDQPTIFREDPSSLLDNSSLLHQV